MKANKIPHSNTLSILEAFGNPHHGIHIVHIAGTNGKGSVTIKIAECLWLGGVITG